MRFVGPSFVCVLVGLALLAPSASAQGGSAACTVPVTVEREQKVVDLDIEPGPYDVTVLDTSELSCDQAIEQFREIMREPGASLPAGWDMPSPGTFESSDGSDSFSVA